MNGVTTDRSSCRCQISGAAGSFQFDRARGAFFIGADVFDACQQIVDAFDKEGMVVSVGVTREFTWIVDDLVLVDGGFISQGLTLEEQVDTHHGAAFVQQCSCF